MIDCKHLHYFWMIANEGSIVIASEKLHLTPQTISGQLSLLENHSGTSLFSRVGRNLEITETGSISCSLCNAFNLNTAKDSYSYINSMQPTAVPQIIPGDMDRRHLAETVSRMDADAESPWMGSRRVSARCFRFMSLVNNGF